MSATLIAEQILLRRQVLLWIGAGNSFVAGIPTDGNDESGVAFRLALVHWNNDRAQITNQLGDHFRIADLAQVLGKVRIRELLIQQGWIDLTPTKSHMAIAAIVAEGFPMEVVTVNYDPLLEIAERHEGLEPAIICSQQT